MKIGGIEGKILKKYDNGRVIDSEDRFLVFLMQPVSAQKSLITFGCTFEIDGFGTQSLNVRVKPASKIVQDLHPELVKWKE